MVDQERYAELEEPTFGTILCDGDFGDGNFGDSRRLYIFAPRSVDDDRPWSTSYSLDSLGGETRFSCGDVWERAKTPNDKCVIIYDPRVDCE